MSRISSPSKGERTVPLEKDTDTKQSKKAGINENTTNDMHSNSQIPFSQ